MNPWIEKVKAYMAKHKCSFKDALMLWAEESPVRSDQQKHSSKKDPARRVDDKQPSKAQASRR